MLLLMLNVFLSHVLTSCVHCRISDAGSELYPSLRHLMSVSQEEHVENTCFDSQKLFYADVGIDPLEDIHESPHFSV